MPPRVGPPARTAAPTGSLAHPPTRRDKAWDREPPRGPLRVTHTVQMSGTRRIFTMIEKAKSVA